MASGCASTKLSELVSLALNVKLSPEGNLGAHASTLDDAAAPRLSGSGDCRCMLLVVRGIGLVGVRAGGERVRASPGRIHIGGVSLNFSS